MPVKDRKPLSFVCLSYQIFSVCQSSCSLFSYGGFPYQYFYFLVCCQLFGASLATVTPQLQTPILSQLDATLKIALLVFQEMRPGSIGTYIHTLSCIIIVPNERWPS